MATGPRYKVPFRRRREGRTDYRRRLALVKSEKARAVVRSSNKHTRIQLVEYADGGDKVLASAVSTELAKLGWTHSGKSTPGAYLTGYLAGKRALEKGVDNAVLDMGLKDPVKGCVLFAAMKGLLDAGVDVPHDGAVLPSDDRIKGRHMREGTEAQFDEVKGKMGGAE
ncbi:MAG: 50S ribosomal protein L18 [Methanobacteriota archaeon]|nr:MAG: 50S ribosomal protein L18 [Euryarchaeota archaeon]